MAGLTRIDELILKKLLGEITVEENSELQALAKTSGEEAFVERMSPDAFHKSIKPLKKVDDRRLDRILKREIGQVPGVLDWVSEKTWTQKAAWPMGIAASMLLVIGFAWWLIARSKNSEAVVRYPVTATLSWKTASGLVDETGVSSGCNSIDLGEMADGMAYKAGPIHISRVNNQYYIHQEPDSSNGAVDPVVYRLTDEGRSTIQLFFQDANRVQLWPNSWVCFELLSPGTPVKANEMYCGGDVLFGIDHNFETPLIVKTLKQVVTVLGTEFRVVDFKKEDTGAVYCYTGMVKVKNQELTTRILKSSQRVTTLPSGPLRVSTGDFKKDAPWLSEEVFFDFSEMRLDTAIKKIAEWYGISRVEYGPGIDKATTGMVFSGKISRNLPLGKLLAIIERNGLHFSLQGDAILVTTNKIAMSMIIKPSFLLHGPE